MSSSTSFLTEEMRHRVIVLESAPVTLEVEKGAIIKFAEAIGDGNPLWNDEVSARRTRFGGIIAPPTFLRSMGVIGPELPFDLPFRRRLDGGSEWEYFEPIRPGDRITAVGRITNLSERNGRLGLMIFLTALITYRNQFDQIVATQATTLICY